MFLKKVKGLHPYPILYKSPLKISSMSIQSTEKSNKRMIVYLDKNCNILTLDRKNYNCEIMSSLSDS